MKITVLPYRQANDPSVLLYEDGRFVEEVKLEKIRCVEISVMERFLKEWKEKIDGPLTLS
jgi:hypothetical protein